MKFQFIGLIKKQNTNGGIGFISRRSTVLTVKLVPVRMLFSVGFLPQDVVNVSVDLLNFLNLIFEREYLRDSCFRLAISRSCSSFHAFTGISVLPWT